MITPEGKNKRIFKSNWSYNEFQRMEIKFHAGNIASFFSVTDFLFVDNILAEFSTLNQERKNK